MKKRWEVQRERVKGLATKWVRRLGLGWWVRVEFRYYTSKEECERRFGLGAGAGGREVLMAAMVDWRYLEAVVTCNLRAMEQVKDEELEVYFVHELMHVLLNELEVSDPDHEERVATWLALAFLWTDQGKG